MGGAAGHLKHVWEASDLSFNQLYDIIDKSLSGKLINITEKLDGQNVLITYRDKKALAARSSKHLKNFGEEALDINKLKDYFIQKETPENVKDAFVYALVDFQNIFDNSEINLDEIFKNGQNWLNVEILCKETENIIPYEKNQLRIHNIRELDETGKIVSLLTDETLNILSKEIDKIQSKSNTFLIKRTNSLVINQIKKSNLIAKSLILKLESLIESVSLSDNNTIEDYVEAKMKEYIVSELSEKELEDFGDKLARRWGRGDKSTPINSLLKDMPEEISDWVRKEDKKINKRVQKIIEPIVLVFTELGITILKNLQGLSTSDPIKAHKDIIEKLSISIDYLNNFSDNNPEDDRVKEMANHLKMLDKVGGIDAIVPTEGVVFEYEDNLLKLTGAFTPLLRIIGFFKFKS